MADRGDILPTPVSALVPRRIKPKRGGRGGVGCARIFMLPHMIIGAALIGCLLLYPVWAIFGTDTLARIIKRSVHHGDSTSYHVEYEYEHAGRMYHGKSDVRRNFYDSLKALDEDKVEADAAPRPTVRVRHLGIGRLRYVDALPPGVGAWSGFGFLVLFALFWNGVVSVFVIMFWILPWRSRRLYRWGRPAKGRITGKMTGTTSPKRDKLEYEFDLPGGGKGSGKMSVADSSEWQQAMVGEPVTVLYLGRDGRSSVIYEYGDFTCA